MEFIEVMGMKFHSYIGHYEEEKQVGTNFSVDLKVKTNCLKAGKSDKLNDAVNYVNLFQIVKKQMQKKCNLVENSVYRITTEIFETFSEIEFLELKVTKLSPQLGGNVEAVSIILAKTREQWQNEK